MSEKNVIETSVLNNERWELLVQLEHWLETPMVVLGFVWLGLLVIELIGNLSPALEFLGMGIWVVFILDFLLRETRNEWGQVLSPSRSMKVKSENQ